MKYVRPEPHWRTVRQDSDGTQYLGSLRFSSRRKAMAMLNVQYTPVIALLKVTPK